MGNICENKLQDTHANTLEDKQSNKVYTCTAFRLPGRLMIKVVPRIPHTGLGSRGNNFV